MAVFGSSVNSTRQHTRDHWAKRPKDQSAKKLYPSWSLKNCPQSSLCLRLTASLFQETVVLQVTLLSQHSFAGVVMSKRRRTGCCPHLNGLHEKQKSFYILWKQEDTQKVSCAPMNSVPANVRRSEAAS